MPNNSAIVTHVTQQENYNTPITQALTAVFSKAYDKSFVGLATRKKGESQVYIQCWVRICNLASYFNHFTPQKYDTYITSNTFKGGFRNDVAHHRHAEHLATINNLVIDLDFHKDYMSHSNLLLLLREYIKDVDEAVENGDMPPYRMWVYTGRGIQFWYSIQPLAPVLKFFADEAIQGLIAAHNMVRAQNKNIFRYGFYDDLTVDTTASQRISGLFRLPCSYNTSVEVFGTYHVNQKYTVPHINNLLDALGIGKQVWQEKAEKKSRKGVAGTRQPKYLPLLMRRRDLLESLNIDIGRREVCSFLYYNNAVQLYGYTEMAERALNRFNDKLRTPLRASQIRSILKAVQRKCYRIPQHKFYRMAQITEDEVNSFMEKKLAPSIAKRKAEQAKQKAKKEQRDDKIRELALQGLSQRQISAAMGIALVTVNHVIKANKALKYSYTVKKEHQLKQIEVLVEAGNDRQSIANKMHISIATVARRLAELRRLRNGE